MKTELPSAKIAQTQQAVAQACNLSRATVGKVLGGGQAALLFNEETRKRVWSVARELGYRPNRAAQATRKGRSNLIAIIFCNGLVEVGCRMAEFLPQEIKARGYEYLVFDYQWHGSSLDSILQEVIQLRVEGVVFLGLPNKTITAEHAQNLSSYGIAMVALDVDDSLPQIPSVYCDSQPGIREMTEHLLDMGHRSILFLFSNLVSRTQQERFAGFQEGIAPRGLVSKHSEPEFLKTWPQEDRSGAVHGRSIVLSIEESREGYSQGVYQFSKKLFASGTLPDAIMCSNDAGAVAVYMAAYEYRIVIPRDLAVTGYDDDRLAAYPMFDLTTARQEVRKSCTTAAEWLVAQMSGKTGPLTVKRFRSKLVLRGSSRSGGK